MLSYYYHNDVIGIVTVSEDNRQYLVSGCGLPPERVFCLLNGIDSSLFFPPQYKARRIAYMDRKNPAHVQAVALMSSLRQTLSRYEFRPLSRMSHPQIASELRESLVFLNFGHPEGFGLPLAEAIACGCIVIGYHGLSGRDFCSSALHTVDFGDILGFVNTLIVYRLS